MWFVSSSPSLVFALPTLGIEALAKRMRTIIVIVDILAWIHN